MGIDMAMPVIVEQVLVVSAYTGQYAISLLFLQDIAYVLPLFQYLHDAIYEYLYNINSVLF
jgi:hypothetical protein